MDQSRNDTRKEVTENETSEKLCFRSVKTESMRILSIDYLSDAKIYVRLVNLHNFSKSLLQVAIT